MTDPPARRPLAETHGSTQTAARVGRWAALNFDRAAGGYKGPDALFLWLFGGDARFMGRCKRLKITSRVRCVGGRRIYTHVLPLERTHVLQNLQIVALHRYERSC